jgi:hypothetical protein
LFLLLKSPSPQNDRLPVYKCELGAQSRGIAASFEDLGYIQLDVTEDVLVVSQSNLAQTWPAEAKSDPGQRRSAPKTDNFQEENAAGS